MEQHANAIRRKVRIQLDHMVSLKDGQAESGHGIFRRLTGDASVSLISHNFTSSFIHSREWVCQTVFAHSGE